VGTAILAEAASGTIGCVSTGTGSDDVERSPSSGGGDDGPFDPPGIAWTPVSPRLVTARRLVVGIVMLVLLVPLVVLPVFVTRWVLVGLVPWALVTLWLLWLIARQVRAIGYAEREDDLLIRSGVMFRAMVIVPYGRMQYVDVQAGPLDRALGLAKVQLHTASPGTDAAIPGLAPEEAARLRERLASRGEARLAGL
jgi:uncharacterized protein